MAGGKLTRKEIVQQDVIGKTLAETSHWAVRNLKYIAGSVLAVLVVVVAVLAWNAYSSSSAEAMQAGFGDALAQYHAEVGAAPVANQEQALASKYRYDTREEKYQKALAAFQKLADDYSSSRIGQLSRYYTALCMYELGRNQDARKALEDLIGSTNQVEIKNLARNSLAQVALADKDSALAIKSLEEILAEPTQSFPAQTVLLQLAQLQEDSGDLQGALEKYRKIQAEYPGTSASSEATTKISRLEPRVGQSGSSTPIPETVPVGQ